MSDITQSEVTKKPPKKGKAAQVKLPTPPPDPVEHASTLPRPSRISRIELGDNTVERENTDESKEVLDYIESLHKGLYLRSTSTYGPAAVTEEAFDHLEKLYKLMEQMLELREQNVKLHRRIRDLEHLNNLEKIHINPNLVEEDYPDLEKDTVFAEAILESILQDPKNKDLARHKHRSSLLRRRRSCSTTDKPSISENAKEESLEKDDVAKKDKHSKVSKWTKVKAAFRWEKASNVGDSKSQDSGIHVPVNYEIARYLRVPSTSDDMGHSAGDSGAGISTPGSISSASSNDDFQRIGRTTCDDLRSSDDENATNYIPHHKDYRHKFIHKSQLRNPWSKMKDIIHHPRSSLKKKHRLSAASDDIQIDVEFCSDNDDVFESDDPISKSTHLSLSPSPNVCSTSSTSPTCSDIPPRILERYQKALAEDSTSDSETKSSRWVRVRKAFLTRDHPITPKTSNSSQVKDKLDDDNVEEEIKRNYFKLRKKISLEFQDKLSEWDRFRQSSPGASSPTVACGYSEEAKDPSFARKMEEWQKIKNQSTGCKPRISQVTKEYDLPPDFKKKLQEWEKIKKTSAGPKKKLGEVPKWKSLGGPRPTDQSVFEYPAISDDFRKKLDEWKQIKASGGPSAYTEQKKLKDKTPSPKLSRKNSSSKQNKKQKDQTKELHWFEKELGKIEKEKLRLERERQKFIEREERLSKLRKSILGGPSKKEVLIHTPSGFHRFEGISRKFTQKLYEWEKSQGIAPEASTFALLSSSHYASDVRPNHSKTKNTSTFHHATSLTRSKSADSIAVSALNLACPLMSGTHPSSLSLNDMDDLEKECLGGSKASSLESHDTFLDEPEAVLVEVEDYEEETAEPLHVSCVERQQLPVYQRQECKPLCESETIALPKVRRSESARAQNNYDLMESIGKLLTELQVTEDEIRCLVENKDLQESQNKKSYKFLNELQSQSIKKLTEILLKLLEANNSVASNIAKDPQHQTHSTSLEQILNIVQNTSQEMLRLTEEMNETTSNRYSMSDIVYPKSLFGHIKELRMKIADVRRHLSYVCASADGSVTISQNIKKEVSKTTSNESKTATSDDSRKNSEKERRFVKMEGPANLSASQGAVKKRIRYRQKTLQKTLVDTDDEDIEVQPQKTIRQHKKLTRTRSISDGNLPPAFDKNFLSPETPYPETSTSESRLDSSPSESAITLFVKTTRKLFTPLVETSLSKNLVQPLLDPSKEKPIEKEASQNKPYVPASPVPQRKVFKEVSPSIKAMMAKFNQTALQIGGIKSAGSSGSSSPIAWRSPVSERRVKVQTEKYQEELKKMSPLLGERSNVEKSSSASVIPSSSKQITIPARKASLNSSVPTPPQPEPSADIAALKKSLTLDISLANSFPAKSFTFSAETRMRKLQKAKEEFLRTPISAPSFISEDVLLQFRKRNRLSQVSVESESSCDQGSLPGALIKSASAGMINIDADVYKRINPEYREEGYVSLPRQNKKTKDRFLAGKSAFSTIASKFRKVKMRRGKDKDKDKEQGRQAVATLCRQSLVVDISPSERAGNAADDFSAANLENANNGDVRRCSKDSREDSGAGTPVSKSGSWIKRSLFKK